MTNNNKQWFTYEPKTGAGMAYAWRMNARNLRNSPLLNFSLQLSELDNSSEYDIWNLENGKDNYPVKIYGNGNKVVENPRIEFECLASEKDLVNKLIENLDL